jgi:hypothetical protein
VSAYSIANYSLHSKLIVAALVKLGLDTGGVLSYYRHFLRDDETEMRGSEWNIHND